MPDDQNDGQDEPKDIRELRRKAKEADDHKAELEAAKRELAFAKAGVDTESKLGKMLFRTYEGDLVPDAIKAEAVEIGLLNGDGSNANSRDDDNASEHDRAQTRRRQDLASESDRGDDEGEDPRRLAKQRFDEARYEGEPAEIASGAYLQTILQAAQNGDRRVLINP